MVFCARSIYIAFQCDNILHISNLASFRLLYMIILPNYKISAKVLLSKDQQIRGQNLKSSSLLLYMQIKLTIAFM